MDDRPRMKMSRRIEKVVEAMDGCLVGCVKIK